METKYLAIHKEDPWIPKNQVIGILKDIHDRYYGDAGIMVVGVAHSDRYQEGVCEGIRRAILFLETMSFEKVEN